MATPRSLTFRARIACDNCGASTDKRLPFSAHRTTMPDGRLVIAADGRTQCPDCQARATYHTHALDRGTWTCVIIGAAAGEILQLDSAEVVDGLGIHVTKWGKCRMHVWGSVDALRNLASELRDRESDAWDQPSWWKRSARVAAGRITSILHGVPT